MPRLGIPPATKGRRLETVLESPSEDVVIGPGRPFCVIGERINPTGRKKFQAEFQQGDLSRLEINVAQQTPLADMLDVTSATPSQTR